MVTPQRALTGVLELRSQNVVRHRAPWPDDDAHQASPSLIAGRPALQAGVLGRLCIARLPRGRHPGIQAFVRRWKADGHLSAVMKDKGAERAKEVLERKAREHKPSWLAVQ